VVETPRTFVAPRDVGETATHVASIPVSEGLTVFQRLAGFSARRRWWVIAVWGVLTALSAPLAVTLTGALSGAGWDAQGSTAELVRRELRRDFATLGAEDAMVVYHQRQPVADDPGALRALVGDLRDAPGAVRVVDPLAQPGEAGLVSRDGRTALIPVALEADEDADLPESAGDLAGFVADLRLPPGARAEAHGHTVEDPQLPLDVHDLVLAGVDHGALRAIPGTGRPW